MISRDYCVARDESDELAPRRDEFILADNLIYLDGNSLGPLAHSTRARLAQTIDHEWAEGLVRSWNDAGWMAAPTRIGDRLAPLIGAQPGEVVVGDSLTFMLAKLIGAALNQRRERSVILTDEANFHSDIYIVEAMAARAGRPVRVKTIDRAALDAELDAEVALVMFTHVDYRTGEMLDLKGITTQVHAAGALMLWDLAHSVGAVPLDVTDANVDFAAGCGYKYLNAGPGAPGFMYVRSSWQGVLENPLPGWLGHARPFAFEREYEPATGMQAFVTSSPPMIALAALDGALDVWDRASIDQVRAKSLAMTDLFLELVEQRLSGVFEVVTPRAHAARASQVALRHRDGYAIIQALIERDVIGDFRSPDICRFAFTPLYLRFVDVFDAVERLGELMDSAQYLDERFSLRRATT